MDSRNISKRHFSGNDFPIFTPDDDITELFTGREHPDQNSNQHSDQKNSLPSKKKKRNSYATDSVKEARKKEVNGSYFSKIF